VDLRERARNGELHLHVPAICLIEARKVIAERRVPDLNAIRSYVRDLRADGSIDEATARASFDVLGRFQQFVAKERKDAPVRVAALARDATLDVFALDANMLARSTELALEPTFRLKPYDLAIFAAVLERGSELDAAGHEVSFCTLDGDLQPWDRNGRRIELADEFDDAGVWVFGDFLMDVPARPPNWRGS
jgi:hypothetical protein